MFTKNWYKALAAQMAMAPKGVMGSVNYAGTTRVQSTYGSTGSFVSLLDVGGSYAPSMKVLRKALADGAGAILGTGTTPPTIDDYCLSGDIVTGYSYNCNASYTAKEDCMELTAKYTITNDNAEEITIGEIGLIGKTGSSPSTALLLERTVLEAPITIEPGGVGQVTYTIRMNYPTA